MTASADLVRFDATRASVVATCRACPSWRVLRSSRSAAQLAAADHLARVHADDGDDDGGQLGRARDLRELAARARATRRTTR